MFENQYLNWKTVEWRLLEVKQHKYKLALGWGTVWWVVLLVKLTYSSMILTLEEDS